MTELKKSSEGFYFLSLSLENVRCFGAKQTLDLSDGNGRPAQWTVILGDNGVGKTTLLNVLAKGLWVSNHKSNLCRINTVNTKIESFFAFNSTLAEKQKEFLKFMLYSELRDDDYSATIYTPKDFPNIEVDDNFLTSPTTFNVGGYKVSNNNIKLFFYTASRRLKKDNNLTENSENKIADTDELINAEKWLLDIDYIASKPSDIQKKYRGLLNAIKETLKELLPYVTDIRITQPSEELPNPRVQFQIPEGWLSLSQLSLGYQTMIAWMVDLSARLFKEYPNSKNPIAEPAVVLIDEIDLHLHPKWQRTIMSYLSERFINTQFIVTAHSPLIVQAAENANIVVLKRENDNVIIQQQHKDIQGWRVDQLLASDLFGLSSSRSVKYEELLNKRRAILSKAKLTTKDKKELKELELETGDLPTAETPEDIKAMDIIRRAAKLLESET